VGVLDARKTVAQPVVDARIAPVLEKKAPLERPVLPFHMEAWMPETIAMMKLEGFIKDNQGKVLEYEPSRVLLRLNGTKAYSAVGWLGLTSKASGPLEVELKLEKVDPRRDSHLNIHVLFHPAQPSLMGDKFWCDRCMSVYLELRAYLMGGSML
jgi:serine/threonine-protein kinase